MNNKIKLYFIPHAGGSAIGYTSFKKFVDCNRIEVVPLELAGRGKRIQEKCFESVTDCAKDLFSSIKENIIDNNYAFFGHSLGTLITFELAKYINKQQLPSPKHIFFSGRVAPNADFDIPKISDLSDKEFLEKFHKLQGEDSIMFSNPELVKLLLPTLRADIRMAETYKYTDNTKLNCNISVYYGNADILIEKQKIYKWYEITTENCTFKEFDGGHFYYSSCKKDVGLQISETLK